jgi:hypothetical protein
MRFCLRRYERYIWKRRGQEKEQKQEQTVCVIHYYAVSTRLKEETLFSVPFKRAQDSIASTFGNSIRIELEEKVIVRSVGPRTYPVALDLRCARALGLTEEIALLSDSRATNQLVTS